jgi:hypothetical protein
MDINAPTPIDHRFMVVTLEYGLANGVVRDKCFVFNLNI